MILCVVTVKPQNGDREKAGEPQNGERKKAGEPRGKPQIGKAGRGKPLFNAKVFDWVFAESGCRGFQCRRRVAGSGADGSLNAYDCKTAVHRDTAFCPRGQFGHYITNSFGLVLGFFYQLNPRFFIYFCRPVIIVIGNIFI